MPSLFEEAMQGINKPQNVSLFTEAMQGLSFDIITPAETAIPGTGIDPQPKEQVSVFGEAMQQPGVWDIFKHGMKMNNLTARRGKIGNDAMFGITTDNAALWDESLIEDEIFQMRNLALERPEGIGRKVTAAVGQTVPFMFKASLQAAKYGAITGAGLGVTALMLGQLPPLTAIPEELATIPAALGFGFAKGGVFGIVKYSIEVEGGNLYLNLIKKGVDPKIAKPTAIGAGTAIGLLEVSQIGRLARLVPGIKMFAGKAGVNVVKKTFGGIIKSSLKQYAKDTGKEWGEEILQEMVNIFASTFAHTLDAQIKGEDYEGPTIAQNIEQLKDTAVQSGYAMPVLTLLPHIANTSSNVYTFNQYNKAQKAVEQKRADIESIVDKEIADIEQISAERLQLSKDQVRIMRQAGISDVQLDLIPEEKLIEFRHIAALPLPDEAKATQMREFADRAMEDIQQDLPGLTEQIENEIYPEIYENRLFTQPDRTFSDVVQEGVEQITGSRGIETTDAFVESMESQGVSPGAMDKFKRLIGANKKELAVEYLMSHVRMERILEEMDNWQYNGINHRTVMDPLLASRNTYIVNKEIELGKLQGIFEGRKIKSESQVQSKVGRFNKLTKSQALFVYANMFNQHNLRHLHDSGISDKDMGDIVTILDEKDKSMVTELFKYYKEQHPRKNAIYKKMKGHDLAWVDDYFPINDLQNIGQADYDPESISKSPIETVEMEMDKLRDFTLAKVDTGSVKERVFNEKAFGHFNFYQTVLRNMNDVELYISYAESIHDVNKYLKSPSIRASIMQKYGKQRGSIVNRMFDKWVEDISFGGRKESLTGIEKIIKTLRHNLIISALGLNFNVGLKQSVSWIQGSGLIGLDWASRGTQKFVANPKEARAFMEERSPYMKNRHFTLERELREMFEKQDIRILGGQIAPGIRARQFVMSMVTGIDGATTTSLWRGAYDKVMQTNEVGGRKIPQAEVEKRAIEYADYAIRKTQPTAHTMDLPAMFRGNEFQKLFTVFKNQLNQNFNLAYEIQSKFAGKNSPRSKLGHDMAFYLAIPALMIGLINRRPSNREELKKWSYNIPFDLLTQISGGTIFLSGITSDYASADLVSSWISQVAQAGWKVKQGKFDEAFWKAIETYARVRGVPLTAIKRTIRRPLGFFAGPRIFKAKKEAKPFTLGDAAKITQKGKGLGKGLSPKGGL